jgi:hypothetical protein
VSFVQAFEHIHDRVETLPSLVNETGFGLVSRERSGR